MGTQACNMGQLTKPIISPRERIYNSKGFLAVSLRVLHCFQSSKKKNQQVRLEVATNRKEISEVSPRLREKGL